MTEQLHEILSAMRAASPQCAGFADRIAALAVEAEAIPQYRHKNSSDWYDGTLPENYDACAEFETRTVYTTPPAVREVVAWLCVSPDGSQVDATPREFVRDDYRRFGRTITPLYLAPKSNAALVEALREAEVLYSQRALLANPDSFDATRCGRWINSTRAALATHDAEKGGA